MEYLDQYKIETLVTRVGREISEGLLPAAQIAIGYDNQIVFSKNFGDTKPDSLFCIFSLDCGSFCIFGWGAFPITAKGGRFSGVLT